MNHKRKRPKSARAGCLLCKPHKANGCKSKGHMRLSTKLRKQELAEGEDTYEERKHLPP